MTSPFEDLGVANERTALAWRRSAMSMLAVAGLFLHAALHGGVRPLAFVVMALLAGGAAVADHHAQRLYHERARSASAVAHRGEGARRVLSSVTLLAAGVTLVELLAGG